MSKSTDAKMQSTKSKRTRKQNEEVINEIVVAVAKIDDVEACAKTTPDDDNKRRCFSWRRFLVAATLIILLGASAAVLHTKKEEKKSGSKTAVIKPRTDDFFDNATHTYRLPNFEKPGSAEARR